VNPIYGLMKEWQIFMMLGFFLIVLSSFDSAEAAPSPVWIDSDKYSGNITVDGDANFAIFTLTLNSADSRYKTQDIYLVHNWPSGINWEFYFLDANYDELEENLLQLNRGNSTTINFAIFCSGACSAGDTNEVKIYAKTDPRFYNYDGNVTDNCGSSDCKNDTTAASASANVTNTILVSLTVWAEYGSQVTCDVVSNTGDNKVYPSNTTLWGYTLTNVGWNDDFYQFTSVVTSADGHNVGYWIVDPGMADGRGLAGHNASAADGVITIVPANNATSGVYNIELAVISVNGAPTAGCNFDVVVPETETEEETKEPYLEVSGMDENHYNGSYVVSNQTFGGRPILVHENENADTTYIFYHSEREEWIIQPVEPSDEWNAHMIGKGDVWDPAEAIWDNDNYTMVLEWIGGNPTSDWHDDESEFCPAEITDENNDTIDDNCLAVFDDPEESDIVEEVVPSVSLISAIAVLGTIVIFRRN